MYNELFNNVLEIVVYFEKKCIFVALIKNNY